MVLGPGRQGCDDPPHNVTARVWYGCVKFVLLMGPVGLVTDPKLEKRPTSVHAGPNLNPRPSSSLAACRLCGSGAGDAQGRSTLRAKESNPTRSDP
jgi:hypothetical protein